MWKIFDKTDTVSVSEMDQFVNSHENSHFMQTSAWADVKTFWDWRGISIFQHGGLVASMSVLIRPLPLGFSLLYAPRGPVGNRNDPNVWHELMEALLHLAKKKHALLLHIDPDEPDSNDHFRSLMFRLGFTEQTDEGFGNIQPQYVFRLQLENHSQDQIFRAFCAKTRYNIGLSLRKGVTVREYSGDERIPDFIFQNFHSLMRITGIRDNFYIRDLPYFQKLVQSMEENAKIFVAYLQGQPIAGAIEVFCGKKAWYLYGASANEHRNVMPNYLLQWFMIQRAMERGCSVYDFRGVPGNVSEKDPLYGLYRFKKGFSGTHTKFTGLFTYRFRPMFCKFLQLGMKFRYLKYLKPIAAKRQHRTG